MSALVGLAIPLAVPNLGLLSRLDGGSSLMLDVPAFVAGAAKICHEPANPQDQKQPTNGAASVVVRRLSENEIQHDEILLRRKLKAV